MTRPQGTCISSVGPDIAEGRDRDEVNAHGVRGDANPVLVCGGGTGGLIAVDKNGNVALPFSTSGMYRGHVREDGKFVIEMYK